MNFSSLTAPEVVISTTYCTSSDENLSKINTFMLYFPFVRKKINKMPVPCIHETLMSDLYGCKGPSYEVISVSLLLLWLDNINRTLLSQGGWLTTGNNFTQKLWAPIPNLAHKCVAITWKIDSQIRSQFCICHKTWAAMACANLSPDLLIKGIIKAKTTFKRFHL